MKDGLNFCPGEVRLKGDRLFFLPVHFCQKVEGDQYGDPLS